MCIDVSIIAVESHPSSIWIRMRMKFDEICWSVFVYCLVYHSKLRRGTACSCSSECSALQRHARTWSLPSLPPAIPRSLTIWTFNDINSPTQLTIIIHICESTPPPTDANIIFIIECILSFLERSVVHMRKMRVIIFFRPAWCWEWHAGPPMSGPPPVAPGDQISPGTCWGPANIFQTCHMGQRIHILNIKTKLW